jgi:inosine-uridine nucleoside N-ribohydrolase
VRRPADGALTLGILLSEPRIELVGVSGGDAGATRSFLESAGRGDVPVSGGREAAAHLAECAEKYRKDLVLVCAGEATAIAQAFTNRDVARALRRIVVVGGVWAPAGAVPWVAAEKFFGADPAAAQVVLRAPCERVLIPATLGWRLPLDGTDVQRHRALRDPYNLRVARHLRFWLLGRKRVRPSAALAAMYVLAPEMFTTSQRLVEIVGKGFLREQRGACPSDVAFEVAVDGLRSVYWAAFAALAGLRTSR